MRYLILTILVLVSLVPFVGCSHNSTQTSWKGKVTGMDYNYSFSEGAIQIESLGAIDLLKERKEE